MRIIILLINEKSACSILDPLPREIIIFIAILVHEVLHSNNLISNQNIAKWVVLVISSQIWCHLEASTDRKLLSSTNYDNYRKLIPFHELTELPNDYLYIIQFDSGRHIIQISVKNLSRQNTKIALKVNNLYCFEKCIRIIF